MMGVRTSAEFLLLGALWGASFLFMRVAAPEFGPMPLVFVRVGVAALVLLPVLVFRRHAAALRQHWRPILVVGLVNTALPFAFFNVAALVLNAGLSGIFNATAPLWAAAIAWLWLGERPTAMRTLGLALGFAGVLGLAWNEASFKPGVHGVSPAIGIVACLVATLCYGWSVSYAKRRLAGVPPMAVAAGSQLAAAALMALPAWWWWPQTVPGATAWAAATALAAACTALAYVLYFRLIRDVGPAQAIAVTFLIPPFAILWGVLVLGEAVTVAMVAGCAVVLLGTALATGLVGTRR
jgi:drug/metabolite transporter (DMT)-like permease